MFSCFTMHIYTKSEILGKRKGLVGDLCFRQLSGGSERHHGLNTAPHLETKPGTLWYSSRPDHLTSWAFLSLTSSSFIILQFLFAILQYSFNAFLDVFCSQYLDFFTIKSHILSLCTVNITSNIFLQP